MEVNADMNCFLQGLNLPNILEVTDTSIIRIYKKKSTGNNILNISIIIITIIIICYEYAMDIKKNKTIQTGRIYLVLSPKVGET